jgi:hypothetical protein
MMSRDFAHISAAGPVRSGQIPGSIGVLEAPDHLMPVEMANCTGWDPAELAVWHLTVEGTDMSGWWVIVDRGFRPVEG